jgi:hypothetical protein
MKLILSRKGFDTGTGGGPSPVLPNAKMVSLPIPEAPRPLGAGTPYTDINTPANVSMAALIAPLAKNPKLLVAGHLDPDLDPGAKPRTEGWHASLGQSGAAASHLVNQGVGPGDLFVFWGLFRQTVQTSDGLTWQPGAKPFHAIFGWMTVADVLRPGQDDLPQWLCDHPHVVDQDRVNNTLYVSNESGLCDYADSRRLTAPGSSPSLWSLPKSLHPDISGNRLSYHRDPSRWENQATTLHLRTAARGQEFVTELTDPWKDWIAPLIGR